VTINENYGYDLANELTLFNDPDPWPQGASNISTTYDAAHNVATYTQTNPQSQHTWTNTLNGADWITSARNDASPPLTFTYQYDNNGNQTSATGPSSSYTYSYDVADRPYSVVATISGVETIANFVYDGDGLRITKSVPTAPGSPYNLYVYDRVGKTPVLLEDGNRRYVPGPMGILYTTAIGGGGAPQLVYHTDQQGSVRAITNPATPPQLVYSTRYEPYGIARHTASVNNFAGQALGYAGAAADPEVILLYLNARYYSPGFYRFLQRDSLFGADTDPISLNRYAYAHNNPMVYSDPSGHEPLDQTDESEELIGAEIVTRWSVSQIWRLGVPTIPAAWIRFSQQWVSRGYSLGTPEEPAPLRGFTIESLASALRTGVAERIPTVQPIQIFYNRGLMAWQTLHNRRLAAYQMAGAEIPYEIVNPEDPGMAELIQQRLLNNPGGVLDEGRQILIGNPNDPGSYIWPGGAGYYWAP